MNEYEHTATSWGDAEMQDINNLPPYVPWSDRWRDLDYLLDRVGPYATSEFIPGEEVLTFVRHLIQFLPADHPSNA